MSPCREEQMEQYQTIARPAGLSRHILPHWLAPGQYLLHSSIQTAGECENTLGKLTVGGKILVT